MAGMKHGTKCAKWTTHELQILRKLYPTGGIKAVYEALQGRHTKGSIRTTAWNNHIRCDLPPWKLRLNTQETTK